LNIYHEARGENIKGQVAIAAVTMNRVKDESFPNTVCAVVKQSSAQTCQFSWWCDGRADVPRDVSAWGQAKYLAWLVLVGLTKDPTNGALFFHTKQTKPGWSTKHEKTARIGQHLFYKPRYN
jgi:spore germination cell wall hydrolase CwlJ-like protein